MDNQAKRVQIWPGVTPWAVTEVLENYVLASKAPDLQHAFKPVLSFTKDSFKAVPTIAYLTQFNSLLQDCIALAKNGKMSHVTIMRALSKLLELHPSWLGTASKTLLFPAVSRCQSSPHLVSRSQEGSLQDAEDPEVHGSPT